MEAMSVKDYNSMAAAFDRADRGECVLIRRKNRTYTLFTNEDRLVITPELQRRIDEAHQNFKEGRSLHFESAESLHKWMDEL